MGVCYEIFNAKKHERFDLDKGLWFEPMPDDLDREKWLIWVTLCLSWRADGEGEYIERLTDALLAFVGDDIAACCVWADHSDCPWYVLPREQWPRLTGDRYKLWPKDATA